MNTLTGYGRGFGFVMGIVAISAPCLARLVHVQIDFVIDAVTGQVPSHQDVRFEKVPGVMFADNMGRGGGYTPGADDISSHAALFFRSSSDLQAGPGGGPG